MACPWIHCNICLRLPVSGCRYFISNCGHVACERCVEKKLIAPKCSLCKRETKVEEINKNLREDLRKYFVNIHDFAVKSFNEVKSVIEFQNKNTRRLMKYKMEKIKELQNTTIKHSDDSATIAKLQQQVDALQARNVELANENKTLNTSFLNQQNLVNQLLSSGNTGMNVTSPSFLHTSANCGNNLTQQDLFNIVNASYLNASATQQRHNESTLQESLISPRTLAFDQSSFNMDQSSFNVTAPPNNMENMLAQQTLTQPSRTMPTPSKQTFSSLRPAQNQISESLRTPAKPIASQSRKCFSVQPQQRFSDAAKMGSSTDKLNHTTRSWAGFGNEYSVLSARTSRSTPSRQSLYKPPVVTTSNSSSNLRTPLSQPLSQLERRSNTVCPHWPRARCRCNKS
uniref:RING-type domain-containing protein n=1 Tax=Panagrolaimus sp. PS1159 TaxID=55785 RepID=A0AC35F8M4_9BILA